MNVLLIGSGGREHALAWKITQSELLETLYCLPGNPGTAEIATNVEGSVTDFKLIKNVVIENRIGLVVVGPEDPLVLGLKDYLENDSQTEHVLFVGPDRLGAMMEGSKDFAKGFMFRHHIPTARYKSFSIKEVTDAHDFLKTLHPPYVLKADGLAAGKGVLIINDYDHAKVSLDEMFAGKFGAAGNKVVIEEFLSGIEASMFVLTDGTDYMILPVAKDYKRALDNDLGLNTGGMGAVSPVPFADEDFIGKVEERIVKPTIKGLRKEGIRYQGFIFIGLMNCGGDPYVIEYNVRMGDPETEVVMPRIKSDLLSHMIAASTGKLASEKLVISDDVAIAAIIVSGGYPGSYKKGYEISGVEDVEGVIVYHSGTAFQGKKLVTKGGRVIAVTSLGADLVSAREKLYKEVSKIGFTDSYYRSDIGSDVVKHL